MDLVCPNSKTTNDSLADRITDGQMFAFVDNTFLNNKRICRDITCLFYFQLYIYIHILCVYLCVYMYICIYIYLCTC